LSETFLGQKFIPLSLENKDILRDYLERYPQKNTGYSFASLVAWAGPYQLEWTKPGSDCLIIRRPYGDDHKFQLLQPIGKLNEDCYQRLVNESRQLDYPLKILSVSKDFLAENPYFEKDFVIEEDRSGTNYVYRASDLAELKSSQYSKKRNLISQFLKLYPHWKVAPISKECHSPCREILLAMSRADGIAEMSPSLRAELEALEFTMHHLEELSQQGVMISVEGYPIAFSLFEILNNKMALIHFEKAKREFKGSYQMINRETAKIIQDLGCPLINREEDLGDEGLRQAKLSYFPVELYPVYNLTLKF
jgi:uncharacterized protein